MSQKWPKKSFPATKFNFSPKVLFDGPAGGGGGGRGMTILLAFLQFKHMVGGKRSSIVEISVTRFLGGGVSRITFFLAYIMLFFRRKKFLA